MSAYPDWDKYVVTQRRPQSGCIPTGYEILLHAAGVEGIDFESFQDEFDLDKDLQAGEIPRNNFDSVAEAIHQKYPHVKFERLIFGSGKGDEKLKFIEKRSIYSGIKPNEHWHCQNRKSQ